jgi:hypothetical protein
VSRRYNEKNLLLEAVPKLQFWNSNLAGETTNRVVLTKSIIGVKKIEQKLNIKGAYG